MIKKKCIYFICTVLLFAACNQTTKNTCLIEGKISNLTTQNLFFVSERQNQSKLQVDTVVCKKDGSFSFRIEADSLSPVLIYFEDGKYYTTVWLQNQPKITLSGDITYPELILADGGAINKLLTVFKEKNRKILKERRDLIGRKSAINSGDSLVSGVINESLYSSKILNLHYTLKEKAEAFIKKRPESPAGLILFREFILTWGEPTEAKRYLDLFKGKAAETSLYKKLSNELNEKLERIQKSSIGAIAPDFSVVTLGRKDTINLDSFKNKYLLLTFSASWCDFCVGSYTELIQIRKKISNNKLGMLTISLDKDKNTWSNLVKRKKMNWYHSVDTAGWKSSMIYRYNVNEIPVSVLIDKDKVIVGRNLPKDSLIRIVNRE